jgi:hypothetical protein
MLEGRIFEFEGQDATNPLCADGLHNHDKPGNSETDSGGCDFSGGVIGSLLLQFKVLNRLAVCRSRQGHLMGGDRQSRQISIETVLQARAFYWKDHVIKNATAAFWRPESATPTY